MAELIARFAQPGRVVWIGQRPDRRAAMMSRQAAVITLVGLEGDRSRAGKRALTLIQAEHLKAIGAYLDRAPVAPEILRRNIVVEGINLAALKGREVSLGTAVARLSGICAPCSRMEEALGHGGYSAVRGHGGWCAEVVTPGTLTLGDTVTPLAGAR